MRTSILTLATAGLLATVATGAVLAAPATPQPAGQDAPPMPPPPPGAAHRDPLGDKPITRADAATRAGALFDRMDANHDGTLTSAERRAAFRAHRKEMRGGMMHGDMAGEMGGEMGGGMDGHAGHDRGD